MAHQSHITRVQQANRKRVAKYKQHVQKPVVPARKGKK